MNGYWIEYKIIFIKYLAKKTKNIYIKSLLNQQKQKINKKSYIIYNYFFIKFSYFKTTKN